VLGVLLGYVLCFHVGLGVQGLWIGIASGDTATSILNAAALAFVRWGDEAHKAKCRVTELAPAD